MTFVHFNVFFLQFPMGPGPDGPMGGMGAMEQHHMNGSLGEYPNTVCSVHSRHLVSAPEYIERNLLLSMNKGL